MFPHPLLISVDWMLTVLCIFVLHELINDASGKHITIKAWQSGQLHPHRFWLKLHCGWVNSTDHTTHPLQGPLQQQIFSVYQLHMHSGAHISFLGTNLIWVQDRLCCTVHVFPSFLQASACIVHSSVTAPSVCRKNGEALSRPLRGLKYAGLLQSPSKHTKCCALLQQAGFNSAWASWRGEPVGARPGKWLKLTAESHQKTSPSTFTCFFFLFYFVLPRPAFGPASDFVHDVAVKHLSLQETSPPVCHLYCSIPFISLRWLIHFPPPFIASS